MGHRLGAQAADDLDYIWLYVAKESGSIEISNRLIDSITDRFFLLACHPYLGRARDDDFGAGSRSFSVGEYVIIYCIEAEDVLILRVVHGRRDLGELFDN
ncbi:MAG TPA: type II toxin-antitoxin system RelE/ParE family toxin [Candidatus Sulfotelmatobacter sp.]|jgi:toxin ParE1/3/4|nr:type II toxin-antitoxin system RelE/ParE family toxin [Candidatus Sulfotelmatobacter sp.]